MSRPLRGKIKAPRKLLQKTDTWDQSWAVLKLAIWEIFQKNASQLSFEELYRNAYTIVLNKNGAKLYSAVRDEVIEYTKGVRTSRIEPALAAFVSKPEPRPGSAASSTRLEAGASFITAIRLAWSDQVLIMSMIKDVLKYMDKVYSKQAGEQPIYDCGLDVFCEHLLFSDKLPMMDCLNTALIEQITAERSGDMVSRLSLRACIEMLQTVSGKSGQLTAYESEFEAPFITATRIFYNELGSSVIEDMTSVEYLTMCRKRLDEEEERLQSYLGFTTRTALRSTLEQTLLAHHADAILSKPSGVSYMIQNNLISQLNLLYTLFKNIDADFVEMRSRVAQCIQLAGNQINETFEQATRTPKSDQDRGQGSAAGLQWVNQVIDLQSKYWEIGHNAFESNISFEKTISGNIADFVNQNDKCAELVSLFIDEHLKKGLKGMAEVEVDATLDRIIRLFRYVRDKDMFERYYKLHLAKRLLYGRSVSDDAEKTMISKLRVEVGTVFTFKLEGMFTDMRLSHDATSQYKAFCVGTYPETYPARQIDMNTMVLTESFWPPNITAMKNVKCILPDEVNALVQSYEAFYHSRHNGRTLKFHPGLGNADIRTKFRKRRHELNVSTYAMVVLLLFNHVAGTERLTYHDIARRTMIDPPELKRTLQSLACAKYKILIKEPKGRDVADSDSFYFNEAFESPLARIKIATVAASRLESAKERKDTMEKLEEARRHLTDACIVRIMKSRKHLDHNNLISEVTGQLSARFQPDPTMIKKRIESLLEREYLQRREDDRRVYEYLA